MKGNITTRGDSYRVAVSLGKDPATGKYKQHFETVKGSKAQAQKRLRELLSSLDNGSFVKPGKLTVVEYLRRWLKEYAWSNLAPRTAEGYEYIAQVHLIPALGAIPLAQLKPEHLQRYYSDRLSHGRHDGKGGLSPQSVRHHHMALHGALTTAVKWGLVQRNVADAVSPPRAQSPEMQTWTEDEVRLFLLLAKGSEYYPIFYLALYTGLRRSELLALRWTDVDWLYCQLSVNRSLHHLRDGRVTFRAPKTAKGRRTVALPPSAVQVLREHHERREALAKALDRTLPEDGLVFCHVDGTPLLPNSVTHAWIKLVRRTGLKDIRLHDCRHTHASLMLKGGIHPKVVQERLGHSSIAITLDTYSHVTAGIQEAAANRFDDILASKVQT